jgi:type III restriction enzyme
MRKSTGSAHEFISTNIMNLSDDIRQFMSLREPQSEALRRLEQISEPTDYRACTLATLAATAKEIVDGKPELEFDTDFASFCFAIATGVGKTRLMGASIYLLWQLKKYRNFFILAPNTTIYEKLKSELLISSPKYMFIGLSDFPTPRVYDGENYLSYRPSQPHLNETEATVFVFNIQKIQPSKGERDFKFHRYQELLGESFAGILQRLDDLVVLMDESHRYRAPVSLGAIHHLKPALGLEFTATPKFTGNILYSFPLGKAIGRFVKTPTVVTRSNLTAADREASEPFEVTPGVSIQLPIIERLKLLDGMFLHERKKARLEEFCQTRNFPAVKPFVLVSTKDTDHAKQIRSVMESAAFCGGRYAGKVIEIHSKQSGEESDENVAKLLSVENPTNAVEVVIHVNMLKEGWDVKNLYTIIPLRASVSEILTEQTIGRGLRLPFPVTEKEVAEFNVTDPDIVELEIVSHDRYEEIVSAAKTSNLFRVKMLTDRDFKPLKTLQVPSLFPVEVNMALRTAKREFIGITSQELANDPTKLEQVIEQVAQKQVAVIEAQRQEHAAAVAAQPAQGEIFKPGEKPVEEFNADKFKQDLKEKLRVGIQRFAEKNIDIPQITTIVINEEVRLDFIAKPTLTGLELVEQKLRATNLATGQERTDETVEVLEIAEPRKFLAGRLLQELDEIDFTDSAFVLKAVDEYIAGLGKPEAELQKLVHLYRVPMLEDLKTQIRANIRIQSAVEHSVADGFVEFKEFTKTIFADGGSLPLREQISQASEIRRYLFTGLTKCLFDRAAFDSTPEKILAEIMEDDKAVIKWLRLPVDQMPIQYAGRPYNPDFVAETETRKYLLETKDRKAIYEGDVLAKAKAAIKWCEAASKADKQKPWEYKLIPDDVVIRTNDFKFTIAQAVTVI